MSTATAAHNLKAAFKAAVTTLLAADTTTLVAFGPAGQQEHNVINIVEFGDWETVQEPGPLSATNRARDEVIALTVTVTSWRPGGVESEAIAALAASDLMEQIEYYARKTDTTIAGTARQCFATSMACEGTPVDALTNGRTVTITATFTAVVRITGTT